MIFLKSKYRVSLQFWMLLLSVASGTYSFCQIEKPLQLKDCIRKTLENPMNTTSLENLEKIELLNKRIVETNLFPVVGINGNYNHFIQNSTITYNGNLLPPSTILNARSSNMSGTATASLDIVNLGKQAFLARASKFSYEEQKIQTLEDKNSLIRNVVELYSNCIISQVTVQQLTERVENSNDLLNLANINLRSGAIDSTEFLTAVVNLENDKTALSQSQTDFSKLKGQLTILLGLDINQDISFSSIDEVLMLISGIEKQNSSKHFVLEKMHFQLKEVENQRRSSYFDFVPGISLFGGYNLSDQQFQNNIFKQNRAFGPTYGIGINYSFGQLKNAFHQSRIRKLQHQTIEQALAKKRIEIELENRNLNQSIEHYKQSIESKEIVVLASKRNLEKLFTQFQVGKIRINDVRIGQNQLLLAEISRITAIKEYLITVLTKKGMTENLTETLNL